MQGLHWVLRAWHRVYRELRGAGVGMPPGLCRTVAFTRFMKPDQVVEQVEVC